MYDEKFIEELATALAPKVAALMDQEKPAIVIQRWMTFKQAASMIGKTERAVRGMARAKLFPIKKMGGCTYIDIREFEKAFAEHTEWLDY